MLTKSRIKWGGSIILAGILLTLAFIGGNWGTSYAANVSADVPHIDLIVPDRIIAGSPTRVIFISGSNFGDSTDTAVRFSGNGTDEIYPGTVLPTQIWVTIPADLLVIPITYDVTVVMSTVGTLPTIPITPYDLESNSLPLEVVEGFTLNLPIVLKNTVAK